MLTPGYPLTATTYVLPAMMLDFTTAVADARVTTTRALDTATRTNASGVLETVNANLPRYDFNPATLVCRGQLIEEARTNFLINSKLDGTNLATQSTALSAIAYTLSFYGTGTITLSGGISATVTGSGAYPTRTTYTFTPSAGSTTFTVSGTVQYAQLEAGSFATSFIPTPSGAFVQRNGDVVSMTGTNFSSWFNASAGAVAVQFNTFFVSGANRMFALSDNTLTNRIDCRTSVTSELLVVAAGSTVANLNADNVTANVASGVTVTYAQDNFGISINGGAAATDPSGAVPTIDRLYIGSDFSGANFLNGHVQTVRYWRRTLTTAELSAFSKRT